MRLAFLTFLASSTLSLTYAIKFTNVELLCMVNKERRKAGLQPLGIDPALTQAALKHSQDQARRRKMSHTGGDGSSPSKRVERAGFNYRSTGENVAYGYRSMEEVMREWMNSPGHRRNILDKKYTMFGSAIAYSGSTPYFTQEFGDDGKGRRNVPKCDGSDSAYGGQGGDAGGDYGGNMNDGGDDAYGGGNKGGNDYSSGGGDGGDYGSDQGGNDYDSGKKGGRGGRGGKQGDYGSDQGGDDYGSGKKGGRGGRGGKQGDYGSDQGGNDYGSGKKGGRGGRRGGRGGKQGDYGSEQGGDDYGSGKKGGRRGGGNGSRGGKRGGRGGQQGGRGGKGGRGGDY